MNNYFKLLNSPMARMAARRSPTAPPQGPARGSAGQHPEGNEYKKKQLKDITLSDSQKQEARNLFFTLLEQQKPTKGWQHEGRKGYKLTRNKQKEAFPQRRGGQLGRTVVAPIQKQDLDLFTQHQVREDTTLLGKQ